MMVFWTKISTRRYEAFSNHTKNAFSPTEDATLWSLKQFASAAQTQPAEQYSRRTGSGIFARCSAGAEAICTDDWFGYLDHQRGTSNSLLLSIYPKVVFGCINAAFCKPRYSHKIDETLVVSTQKLPSRIVDHAQLELTSSRRSCILNSEIQKF